MILHATATLAPPLSILASPQVVTSGEWAAAGQALEHGQPLPVPAISCSSVGMRLKAEIAQQRASLADADGPVRPIIHGRHAAQARQ